MFFGKLSQTFYITERRGASENEQLLLFQRVRLSSHTHTANENK